MPRAVPEIEASLHAEAVRAKGHSSTRRLASKYDSVEDVVLPIGYHCSSPKGGLDEYERVLRLLERRLLIVGN
jgi:hypothetical protein